MEGKHIELLKKVKALADQGIGGEKQNAEKLLASLMKKHGLTSLDIEEDETKRYFFKAEGINRKILLQCVKRVNYNLRLYEYKSSYAKYAKLKGNSYIESTTAEYIQIQQMFDLYTKLYKKEVDIFFSAFLHANDLLAQPPEDQKQSLEDVSAEEYEKYMRMLEMSSKVKKESIIKQIEK